MARGIHRLTQLQLKRARKRGLYGDGGGLYLQVGPSGSRSWVFRYKRDGRARMMGLGSLAVVDLTEAREQAMAARKALHTGTDPLAARASVRAATIKTIDFNTAVAAYLQSHGAAWKSVKHLRRYATSTPPSSCACSHRSGQASRKPPAACADASKQFSAGLPLTDTAPPTTPPDGRATFNTYSRRASSAP